MAGFNKIASPRTIRMTLWALLAIGVVLTLYRTVIAPRGEVDFRFFWLAGRMWSMGLDPYTDNYGALSHQLLPIGNQTPAWVYPPHWWGICVALAQLSLDHAVMAWRLGSAAMLIGGTWWLVVSLLRDREDRFAIAAGLSGLVCLIEPTANLLAFGQASAPVYLGLCAIIVGVERKCLRQVALGALLVSLKPPMALPILLALMIAPRGWIAVLIAGSAGLVLSLPQLLPFGTVATLQHWLGNLSHYTDHAGSADTSPNTILSCTGPFQLIARLTAYQADPMIELGLGMLVAAGAGVVMWRDRLGGLLLLTVAVVGLLPLHIYDMTIIVVPLTILYAMERRVTWPMAVTVLLVLRPGRIETALHVPIHGGGVSVGTIGLSTAALLLLVVGIAQWLRRRGPHSEAGAA